ncbi:MAG: hypothetical protein ACYDDT_05555 [Sulfuricella sp.]
MLLEAYQLLKNRIGQGHLDNQTHEHFSTNISKAYDTWRLILNSDGAIHGIEPMGEKESPGFWSLVEGTSAKAKRFPALRPALPLLKLDAIDDRRAQLKSLYAARSRLDQQVKEARENKDVGNTIELERKCSENLAQTRGLLLELAKSLPQNPQDFMDAWEFKAAPVLKWQTDVGTELHSYLQQCVKAFGHFCGLRENLDWEYETKAEKGSRDWKRDWKKEIAQKHSQANNAIAERLVSAFVALLERSSETKNIKAITDIFLGKPEEIKKGKKKGQIKFEVNAQLCVDLHLPEALGSTLYTPRMAKMVLACLGTGSAEELPGVCAISGEEGSLLKTKLPVWDSPLFKTPPYSKFSDTPCNQRYGKFGLDGFDISTHLARSLVGALQGMTAPNLEWKTWVKLHNGKFKKQSGKKPIPLKDLMLAHPSFDMDELVTVDVFTHGRTEDADEMADRATQFVDCAERLCRALKERSKAGLGETEYMRIMLVRPISKGQIQLSYAAAPTTKDFVSALEAWALSGNNLPAKLCVPLPYKKSVTDFRWRTPRLLFPEQVCQLLTQQWTRDGSERTYIQGPPIGMVLDLFLRKRGVWEESALRLLEMTLDRGEALLIGAGHVLHREDRGASDPWKQWKSFIAKAQSGKDKRYPDYALAQTISLIGSLLYAMNSTVQDYMNESAYLVGKLLAMMDELHKCYCVVVRDGDIPNALIGNGLLGRAAESPALALEELAERSRIYIGWAKSVGGADEKKKIAVNSARKILRLAQPLAERLHTDQLLEKELSAVGKAHLFLGYLSPVLGGDGNGSATGDDPVETKVDNIN